MLRRSLSDVLPTRSDVIQTLKFDFQDAESYRKAATMALVSIDNAIQSRNGKNGCVNALQKINILRRICNIGQLSSGTESDLLKHGDCLEGTVWDEPAARRALDQFHSLGLDMNCLGCQQPMDELPQLCHLTQCHRLWCAGCFSSSTPSTRPCYCEPLCPSIELFIHSPNPEGNLQSGSKRQEFPTKVKALVTDLQQQPHGIKRYVSHAVALRAFF